LTKKLTKAESLQQHKKAEREKELKKKQKKERRAADQLLKEQEIANLQLLFLEFSLISVMY
jgi:hypothetical protein